ncbi:uncharacterized protein B0H64DRAFT_363255 [Chaetomium fimeti]|uniref:C2H2-type domain-containing protein n=1 Tax=Chaetomium fimeti TaxID=1854472 RepID=A0AAE0HAK5_9PEZI|nr:hypothetical protein B0H64DRAFT_363255 [Chaetomium fimeti]
MLSNPPNMSGLHSRQRQHRRQNSTPSAFDAVKIAPLPSLQQRRPVSHRRGLSLDTRAHPLAPAPTNAAVRRGYAPISIQPNNTGSSATPQQMLREAQQQRATHPGLGQPAFAEQDGSDNFLISPQVTPQSRRFTNAVPGQSPLTGAHGLQFDPYSGPLGSFERTVNPLNGTNIDPSREFDFFQPESGLSTPSFMTFPDSSPGGDGHGWGSETETASTHSRRSSRRMSNGIMDKGAKFEAAPGGFEVSGRPCTPSGQITNEYFSQTPVEASIKNETTPLQPLNRFSEGYDESMEETLKPLRTKNNNRNSGIFQDLRQQAEAMAHTPPRANTIPMAIPNPGLQTPEFMNMRTISAELRRFERGYGSIPTSPVDGPSMFSFMKSDNFGDKSEFPPLTFESLNTIPPLVPPSPINKSPSRRGSPHRRTESVASVTSAASIADINIEETKTETGVSIDDIAAYIQGPDPSDGKWRCLYEGCNKPFGRKENIKSHVQTHLNDRQYQCPTCKKCFVRQHDLKRHAKIHTGIKPYPCECGNSFARHDALTRHRQRGMCIGAFDGVVRKVVKRGRPKKIRPEMDERRDKAERTRRKNKLNSANSASSQSGYSDISSANSPSNDFDGLLDDDHFPDILSASIGSLPNPMTTATMNPSTLAVSAASIPTTTSMAEVFHTALSPSAMSNYSHASHTSSQPPQQQSQPQQPQQQPPLHHHPEYATSLAELHNPPSPSKSVSSHYTHHTTTTHAPHTPPDLLSSPRSPSATATPAHHHQQQQQQQHQQQQRFFDQPNHESDAAGNTSALSDASSIGLGTTAAAHAAAAAGGLEMVLGFQGQHGQGLLGGDEFGGGDLKFEKFERFGGLVGGFEKGGFGERFDEEGFDPVSMFTSGEDVFFGTV